MNLPVSSHARRAECEEILSLAYGGFKKAPEGHTPCWQNARLALERSEDGRLVHLVFPAVTCIFVPRFSRTAKCLLFQRVSGAEDWQELVGAVPDIRYFSEAWYDACRFSHSRIRLVPGIQSACPPAFTTQFSRLRNECLHLCIRWHGSFASLVESPFSRFLIVVFVGSLLLQLVRTREANISFAALQCIINNICERTQASCASRECLG